MPDGRQELIECREVAFAERAGVAGEVVGGFQAFEAGRAGKGEIELVVVQHVEHEDIMAALPQQPQAALDVGRVDEQIGNQDHHAAAGIGFGGAGENVVQLRLVARFALVRARGRSS